MIKDNLPYDGSDILLNTPSPALNLLIINLMTTNSDDNHRSNIALITFHFEYHID